MHLWTLVVSILVTVHAAYLACLSLLLFLTSSRGNTYGVLGCVSGWDGLGDLSVQLSILFDIMNSVYLYQKLQTPFFSEYRFDYKAVLCLPVGSVASILSWNTQGRRNTCTQQLPNKRGSCNLDDHPLKCTKSWLLLRANQIFKSGLQVDGDEATEHLIRVWGWPGRSPERGDWKFIKGRGSHQPF